MKNTNLILIAAIAVLVSTNASAQTYWYVNPSSPTPASAETWPTGHAGIGMLPPPPPATHV